MGLEREMSLVSLIVVLILVGLLLWLVNNYIPMDPKIKQILNVVVVIVVILWLLQVFGILGDIGNLHVGR
ncbi:MAG TPA: Thivi_2564 family membrane protein [Rhizomicrobium sp.]|nr:Thivi_2564 family membrane protein [Rhizomicrobium sp.]